MEGTKCGVREVIHISDLRCEAVDRIQSVSGQRLAVATAASISWQLSLAL